MSVPFPPIDQDPDAVREAACGIVRPDVTECAPQVPKPTVDPSGASDGSSFVLGGVWLVVLWVLLGLAVLALVLVAVRWVRSRRAVAVDDADVDGVDEDDDEIDAADDELLEDLAADATVLPGGDVDMSTRAAAWRAAADRHLVAGRCRQALRCRYRALVVDLGDRGWLEELPGRTSGEHRRRVRSVAPEVAADFDAASDLFDGAWYGRTPVDGGTVSSFVALERRVLDRAGVGR